MYPTANLIMNDIASAEKVSGDSELSDISCPVTAHKLWLNKSSIVSGRKEYLMIEIICWHSRDSAWWPSCYANFTIDFGSEY